MKSSAHRWLILIGIGLLTLVAMLVCLLVPRPAAAHDRERPELDSWYRGLHASDGAWCCDGADANHLADVAWESKNGHYRFRLDDVWWDVPDGAVINASEQGRPGHGVDESRLPRAQERALLHAGQHDLTSYLAQLR